MPIKQDGQNRNLTETYDNRPPEKMFSCTQFLLISTSHPAGCSLALPTLLRENGNPGGNGRCRIRTYVAEATDLQSVPFNHSGNLPPKSSINLTSRPPQSFSRHPRLSKSLSLPKPAKSRRWDSNPQPADYKSAALPIELRRHQ